MAIFGRCELFAFEQSASEGETVRQRRLGNSRSTQPCRVSLVAGALAAVACLVMSGTAAAVPPPPPNPSDSDLHEGHKKAEQKADQVGKLANDLADAEADLDELKERVGRKLEDAKKAMVDLDRARDASQQAQDDASDAKDSVQAASQRVSEVRDELDEFVSGSYQQGSEVGSASAYLGSDDATELLERAQLLDSVADSRLDALDNIEEAQTAKANKESAAREALRVAEQKEDAAEQAEDDAAAAKQAAVEEREQQADEISDLEDRKADIEDQLSEAREHVSSLEGQRDDYEDWVERKQEEERKRKEEEAKQQAAQQQQQQSASDSDSDSGSNSSSGVGGGQHDPATNKQVSTAQSGGATVEQVISRAKSQLGTQYAWGGGNAGGPTRGIRDGGVADAHGDFQKVGFDCSGLMSYAFASTKQLPAYSGYQYTSGKHVPVSQKKRGDMLFWGAGGGTHVALYLGDGMMIEAPYSGGHVRIAPVRNSGIQPYAVRLF